MSNRSIYQALVIEFQADNFKQRKVPPERLSELVDSTKRCSKKLEAYVVITANHTPNLIKLETVTKIK